MQCPNDGTVLAITDRQGIEIDYCPSCRGVWLDRGELDKLIERSEREDDRYRDDDRDRDKDRERYRDDDRDRYRDDDRDRDRYAGDDRPYKDDDRYRSSGRWDHDPRYDYTRHKKKKKSSFLSEIFEMGD